MPKHRNSEREYKLLSEHKLKQLKKEARLEWSNKVGKANQWLEDELERLEQAYDDMHAITLTKVLKKLR